MFINYTLKYMQ